MTQSTVETRLNDVSGGAKEFPIRRKVSKLPLNARKFWARLGCIMLEIRTLLAALHAGRFDELESLARQMLDIPPGITKATLSIAELFLRDGFVVEAEQVLEKGLRK